MTAPTKPAYRTVLYRIHANSRTKYQQMYGLAGACRYAWNHFVGKLRDEYTLYGHFRFGFVDISRQFTLLRRHCDKWLQEYSCNIVRYSLKPIEVQYRKFFDYLNEGLPKFKAKWRDRPSFPIVIGQTAKLDGSWLHIQKIGYVRLTGFNPYPDGIAKSGTVKEENGNWYAYIVYAVQAGASFNSIESVGIDRNVGQIALSDGTIYYAPGVEKRELSIQNNNFYATCQILWDPCCGHSQKLNRTSSTVLTFTDVFQEGRVHAPPPPCAAESAQSP